eukprot:TRINITY_DN483_c0_g1_i1.p2 TRINITY_DN483_c0_g1~~TRINITY_DN483_c0_g1_i1.p2  ORF type:complete len:256 (-),score=111.92 TRINITY_DN483_c0_g1_i1:131-898(-)
MEGVVVKTALPILNDRGARLIFKIKNASFEEVNPVYKESLYDTKKKNLANAKEHVYENLERFITENRVDNLKSKMTGEEWRVENMSKLVELYAEDVWKDFFKTGEEGGEDVNGEAYRMVEKEGGEKEKRKSKGEKGEAAGYKKGAFVPPLKAMMYGFGDVEDPLPETIDMMETMVLEYVTEMTLKAKGKKSKLSEADLLFLVRKDKKKHARAVELLQMNDVIKKSKKVFDEKDLTVYAEEEFRVPDDEEEEEAED